MTMTTTQETNQIQLVTQASQLERDMLTVSSNWEYNAKDVAGYMITADGKIITIKKPRIETRFWFGESGYDFQEKVELASKASRDREYFKQKNIANSKLTSKQANIEAALDGRGKFFLFKICGNQPFYDAAYYANDTRFTGGAARAMTRAELEAYKELIDAALKRFDSRLNTYLKRYGLSKCSYDTYWVDR